MLKIDLLPKHFAAARKNLKLLILFGVLLLVTAGGWLYHINSLQAQTTKYKADTEALQPLVQAVDQYTQETTKLINGPSEVSLWKAQDEFITKADATGPEFWKAFHAIREYIPEFARMTTFGITPPDSVQFTVEVRGTHQAGKFAMNIVRCPAITGITMNGLPAGVGLPGAPGAAAAPTPTAAAPPQPGDPGYLGALPPPEAAPGAPPVAAGGPPAGAPGSDTELITLNITAKLTTGIQIPTPAAGAGAAPAGAGPPGMGEIPGGPPGPGGPEGMGEPPAPGPGPPDAGGMEE
ncbi:MAG: hypothetical protein GX100_02995 [candidate division WS1 bacterium]|nr:hypothetical protein [candidate division WS1 bacterium]